MDCELIELLSLDDAIWKQDLEKRIGGRAPIVGQFEFTGPNDENLELGGTEPKNGNDPISMWIFAC
jgi:hypothetical protein